MAALASLASLRLLADDAPPSSMFVQQQQQQAAKACSRVDERKRSFACLDHWNETM